MSSKPTLIRKFRCSNQIKPDNIYITSVSKDIRTCLCGFPDLEHMKPGDFIKYSDGTALLCVVSPIPSKYTLTNLIDSLVFLPLRRLSTTLLTKIIQIIAYKRLQKFNKNITMIDQVLLQTYIEHLRGKIEDSTTINHHGKELTIEDGKVIGVSDVGGSSTDPDPTPVVPFKDSNKALIVCEVIEYKSLGK